jgi:pyrroline-5-carboxylate reductase
MDPVTTIAFIGGGNMASAILGGLVRQGQPPSSFLVVEPFEAQRQRLHQDLKIEAQAIPGQALTTAALVVWAVKPQQFAEAAAACSAWVEGALQLSVMAGVRCDSIRASSGSARVVRAMPNTPALIGRGICGLYATPEVSPEERALVERVLAPTGSVVWVEQEADLDAVTALSGSGPAYVFYFLEAMVQAGTEMGLDAATARRLAQETFAGAAALASQSEESPATLRERVTSKGGTTYAALTSLQAAGVGPAFVHALHAARHRAEELGRG